VRREARQLRRLETLIDVVYAIVLWRVFTMIPQREEVIMSWEFIVDFLATDGRTVLMLAVGIAVIVIYWLQNNLLLSMVERADGRFVAHAIAQVFFVLLFLVAVEYEGPSSAYSRGFETVTALLLGLSSSWMWAYASKNRRLLDPTVSDAEAEAITQRIKAEPSTAAFAALFVFTPLLWDLSWFAYPMIARFFGRQLRRLKGVSRAD